MFEMRLTHDAKLQIFFLHSFIIPDDGGSRAYPGEHWNTFWNMITPAANPSCGMCLGGRIKPWNPEETPHRQ